MSKNQEISLQTFEVGPVMAAIVMRVTAVTLIIQLPVTPSAVYVTLLEIEINVKFSEPAGNSTALDAICQSAPVS